MAPGPHAVPVAMPVGCCPSHRVPPPHPQQTPTCGGEAGSRAAPVADAVARTIAIEDAGVGSLVLGFLGGQSWHRERHCHSLSQPGTSPQLPLQPAQPPVGAKGVGGNRDARHPSLRPTEDGGATQCVATKGEDMGVIGRHHSQGVRGGSELACPCHCLVQHDGLHQRLLGPAAVVAVINPATCTGNAVVTLSLVPLGCPPAPRTHVPPQPQPCCPPGATHLPRRGRSRWGSCAGCEWLFPSSPRWRGPWRHCGSARTSSPWARRGLGKGGVCVSMLGVLRVPTSNPRAGRRRRYCQWCRQQCSYPSGGSQSHPRPRPGPSCPRHSGRPASDNRASANGTYPMPGIASPPPRHGTCLAFSHSAIKSRPSFLVPF